MDFFHLPEELQLSGLGRLKAYIAQGKRLADAVEMSESELKQLHRQAEEAYVHRNDEQATGLSAMLVLLDGKNANCWELLGLCLIRIKEYQLAKEAFTQALRLNIRNPLPAFYIAQAVEITEGSDKARSFYRNALELCNHTEDNHGVKQYILNKLRKQPNEHANDSI